MKIKKIAISVMFAVASLILMADRTSAVSDRVRAPRVSYEEPKDESTLDLTGKKILTFRWSNQTIPAGGRETFRFRIFKGFTYEVVAAEEIGPRIFSIDVPADRFENGQTYTWRVMQRDQSNMLWSLYDTWSFTVRKGQDNPGKNAG